MGRLKYFILNTKYEPGKIYLYTLCTIVVKEVCTYIPGKLKRKFNPEIHQAGMRMNFPEKAWTFLKKPEKVSEIKQKHPKTGWK